MFVLFSDDLINQYIDMLWGDVVGTSSPTFILYSIFQELYINVLDMNITAFIGNKIIIYALIYDIFIHKSNIYIYLEISFHLALPLSHTYTSLYELILYYVYVWTTFDNIRNPTPSKLHILRTYVIFLLRSYQGVSYPICMLLR